MFDLHLYTLLSRFLAADASSYLLDNKVVLCIDKKNHELFLLFC